MIYQFVALVPKMFLEVLDSIFHARFFKVKDVKNVKT